MIYNPFLQFTPGIYQQIKQHPCFNLSSIKYAVTSIHIEYDKRLDCQRPCFEDELTEGSNLQYKVTNQFDAGDKL